MYTEIFDGLRSYYARYPSRRAAAGFHAAMTMSFICGVALTATLTLGDYLIHGHISWSVALFSNKLLLMLVGVAIACVHVQFGKYTGRYNSVEPCNPPRWKTYFGVYAFSAGLLLLGAVVISLLK